MLVAELLAHELAHPVVFSRVAFGLETGDYEGHFVGSGGGLGQVSEEECSWEGNLESV